MQSTPRAVGRGSAPRVVAPLAWLLLLSLPLLGWIHLDRRPAPLYPSQAAHARAPAVFVTERLPVRMQIEPPARPERLLIPVWTDPERRPLHIALLEPGSDRVLAETVATGSGLARLALPAAAAGPLVLRFGSDAGSRETAPRLLWAEGPPRYAARVVYGGQPLEEVRVLPPTGPLLLIEYPWPSRVLLLGWLALLPIGCWAWRDPRRASGLFVTLALCAACTSALLWQRDYARRDAHIDADRYAECAEQLARSLVDPGAREAVRGWLRAYPHASTTLVPALLAGPVALGVPAPLAFLELSALASLASLLLFLALLERELGVARPWSLVAGVLFASHLLMLRSFARPISDSAGLLLVMATLWLLLRRLRALRTREELALALVVLCHPLARPQGFGYWPFIALALVAVDRWREGHWPPARALLFAQLRIFAPPLLLLAGLYLQFGWFHNVALMLEKATRFRVNATLPIFLSSLVGLVQLLPLLWWAAGRRLLRDPRLLVLAAWGVFSCLLLVLVQAPYWMRHFLPALPAVVALAAVGLAQLGGRRRRVAAALALGLAVVNVAISVWQVLTPGPLPEALAGFISTP